MKKHSLGGPVIQFAFLLKLIQHYTYYTISYFK